MDGTVPTKIYEILKKVVNGNIENFTITLQDSNKKGEGYLGRMFFISLKNKKNGEQLNFVVKQAFSEKTIRDFQPIRDVFLNEIYFYRKLWPILSKFQERIPPRYRFNQVPKCYATTSEDNFEGLVFENLKYQGFVLHEKTKPLEKWKYELIFKLYGRYHAISFAYIALNPEKVPGLIEGIYEVWYNISYKPNWQNSIKIICEQCLEALQPGVDDRIIEKFRKYYVDNDSMKLFRKCLVQSKHCAITHGDCWSNNMMFKYDDLLITNHHQTQRLKAEYIRYNKQEA